MISPFILLAICIAASVFPDAVGPKKTMSGLLSEIERILEYLNIYF